MSPTPTLAAANSLPDIVRRRAIAAGADGRRWLAELDRTLEILASQWELEVEEVLHGGSASWVLGARRRNGEQAVLKLKLEAPAVTGIADEALVYESAHGRGLANLYAVDHANKALLLERLGPRLARLDWPVDDQIRAICSALKSLWSSPAQQAGLTTGHDKALWLADFISRAWTELDAPCNGRTRNLAMDFAAERAACHRAENSVLVHGDAHAENALTLVDAGMRPGATCKLIDPEGLIAEPACDLAVPMREWTAALRAAPGRLARQRCALLAALTDANERAIWQWGFMERVSTGLLMVQIGEARQGATMLAVADQLASETPPPD